MHVAAFKCRSIANLGNDLPSILPNQLARTRPMDASSHPWLQARCPATAALLVHSLLPALPLPPLVPLLQASPVGSHDPATYKVLKAYLHSKRIHGGQAYQTPFLSAAYQSELRLAHALLPRCHVCRQHAEGRAKAQLVWLPTSAAKLLPAWRASLTLLPTLAPHTCTLPCAHPGPAYPLSRACRAT